MTAEVVLMNKQAIAMAADSAGTIGGKIFNSSNKLFMLSKFHPVGIMVYSAAEIMGYPWEAIIKIYRKRLQSRIFDDLESQVEHFLNFLKHSELFNGESQAKYIGSAATIAVSDILREVKGVIPPDSSWPIKIRERIFKSILKRRTTQISSSILSCSLTEEDKRRLIEPEIERLNTFIAVEFKEYGITDELHRSIIDYVLGTIFINPIFMGRSGVVISGFCDKDIFPKTISFQISAIINNELIMSALKNDSVSIENGAAILPFAQGDMVASFVEGINPALNVTIQSKLGEIFSQMPEIVSNAAYKHSGAKKTLLLNGLKTAFSNMHKALIEEIETHKYSEYISPIIDGVANLPPDELGMMAETLVNLTSFKRRISANERETVGGPIDVAVITKGDGFVWIKRKHYFDPGKNHHFFANYYQGCESERS